jgi:hypothetical protein
MSGDHRTRAREVLLARVIDLAVERRGVASTLQFDPVIVRLLADHEPFQQFLQRLYGVLVDDAAEEARVTAAKLSGASRSASCILWWPTPTTTCRVPNCFA